MTTRKERLRKLVTVQEQLKALPEVYNRRIGQALARQEQSLLLAREEVERIATATARTNMVERAYRDIRRQDDRDNADRERLEMIERKRQGE
jgi:hypothetical protein